MTRVLFVASAEWEMQYIPRKPGWLFRANGPGPSLAAAAVSAEADVIVSTGICGALDEDLRVGDIVVATEVNGVRVSVPEHARECRRAAVLSVDHVVDSIEERRMLREYGAAAVDMEAAGVVSRAATLGRPASCIKAVSDTAAQAFTVDLNAARGRDGRFSVASILAQALFRPHLIVPELFRLRRDSKRAARALGEFVGDCSF